jgi:uncharacterized protein (TIGR02246 family)
MSSSLTDPATADDVSAINAIAHRWRRAFMEGDAGLFADDYADDAAYINAFGRTCRRGPAIVAFLQEVFDRGDFAAATVTASPPEIRFVRPDVAVAHDFGVTRGQRTPGGAEHPDPPPAGPGQGQRAVACGGPPHLGRECSAGVIVCGKSAGPRTPEGRARRAAACWPAKPLDDFTPRNGTR